MTPAVCPVGCGRRLVGGPLCPPCWGRVPPSLRHAVTVTDRALARQPLNGPVRAYHEQLVRTSVVLVRRGSTAVLDCCADAGPAAYAGQDCPHPETG